MAVRFMLLMPWGRVGSNLLMAILRQSAPMKLDNEQFNRLGTDAEQESWLTEFYELNAKIPSAEIIGSKQNVLAIRDFERMRARLINYGIRLVRLRRDNVVKTAVSQMRAEQYADKTERETGKRHWAVKRGAKRLEATEIDPDVLLRRIELIETLQQRLMTGFADHEALDLEYEEINCSFDETADRLCSFLGIPRKKNYRIPHAKATPNDVRSSIRNLEAVEAKLVGTRYAGMLFDGPNPRSAGPNDDCRNHRVISRPGPFPNRR